MYKLTTYDQGQAKGTGEYDDLSSALTAANHALHGTNPRIRFASGPPACDEYEIHATYKGKEIIVAYGMDDDRALEESKL